MPAIWPSGSAGRLTNIRGSPRHPETQGEIERGYQTLKNRIMFESAYRPGGRWHTFNSRNNSSRVGRILIAYGRDAADVPLTLTFGANTPTSFMVTTEEAV